MTSAASTLVTKLHPQNRALSHYLAQLNTHTGVHSTRHTSEYI